MGRTATAATVVPGARRGVLHAAAEPGVLFIRAMGRVRGGAGCAVWAGCFLAPSSSSSSSRHGLFAGRPGMVGRSVTLPGEGAFSERAIAPNGDRSVLRGYFSLEG